MPNEYNKEGRYSHEKKDCSVIALSYCFDLPYEAAHALCKKAGRKDNDGFSICKLFKVNDKKKYRQFLNRGVSWHKKPGMSVGKFVETHPRGIYYVHVASHAFALIDGVVYNQSIMTQHIKEYWYISAPFNAPKPLPTYESEAEEVAAGEGLVLGEQIVDVELALKKKYTRPYTTLTDSHSLCGLEIMEDHNI